MRASCNGGFWRPSHGLLNRAPSECGSLALAPMTDSPAEAARFLTRNAVDALPRRRARTPAGPGSAAAREAWRGPDHARHPPRSHGGAAQTARVSGPGPPGRADHRRLHGARGGPERALLDAAVRGPGGDRPQRRDLRGTGFQGARPLADRGAAQRRVARHADGGAVSRSRAPPRWPSCSSATTSHSATPPASPSRSSSCSIRSCRATTRWPFAPTSSSGRPTRSSTCCSRARYREPMGSSPQSILTMPILPGIDGVQKMSKSLGNYVGVDDPPEDVYGKLMRVPDEALEVYAALLLDSPLDTALPPRDAKRAMARELTARSPRRRRRPRQPRSASTRCTCDASCPRRSMSSPSQANGEQAVHLPALLADAFGISRSEGRRVLAQAGGQARRRAARRVGARSARRTASTGR